MARQEKTTKALPAGAYALYSAQRRESCGGVYRCSALLAEAVDPQALKRAAEECMTRFPGFGVGIKKGAFWDHFEPVRAPAPPVLPDDGPCKPMDWDGEGWLVRFLYGERRLSLEVFHALCDAQGALAFFRTLLAAYLREAGHDMPYAGHGLLDLREPPLKEEWEDAAVRYAGKCPRKAPARKPAYQNRGTPEKGGAAHISTLTLPVDKLAELAKEQGATPGEYLTAALIKALVDKQRKEKPGRELPVTLAVPMDLRPWFPSYTLRDFTLTLYPSVDPALGEYPFEEVLRRVRHYFGLARDKAVLRAALARRVRRRESRLLKCLPANLKRLWARLGWRFGGARTCTAVYADAGAFKLPHELRPYVERVELALGQDALPRPQCAAVSYGNTLSLTFTGKQRDADAARTLLRLLTEAGLPVQTTSSRRERG